MYRRMGPEDLKKEIEELRKWRKHMLGEDIIRDSWVYALAADEYYHGGGTRQILSDEEYDSLTTVLRFQWSEIPSELKVIFKEPGRLGQGSNHIKLSSAQKKVAESWYSDYRHALGFN